MSTTTSSTAANQLIVERADRITLERLRWLWPQRIPLRKITIFAGLPGEGKNLATIDVAARVTTGRAYPDAENPFHETPGDVLFVSAEDDPEDALVPRLKAAGADLSKVHIVKAVRIRTNGSAAERDLRLDLDITEIENHLRRYPQTRLSVIDPVSNHLGTVSMVAEQEIRQLLRPLQKVAHAHDLSVTGVMHLNKKEGLSAIHRVGGAGAFIGVARASWLFAQDSTDRVMAPLKNNYTKGSTKGLSYRIEEQLVRIENSDEPIPRIEWLGATCVDANDLLQQGTRTPQTPRADAKAFLIGYLAGGPQDAIQVYAAAAKRGISDRTLDRAKADLGIESRKQSDQGWQWALPTEQEPLQVKDATVGEGETGTLGFLQSALQ